MVFQRRTQIKEGDRMRSMTVVLAGMLCSSVLVAQTRVAGPNATCGQVTIMSTITGNINGQPVNGAGHGMLDTTGLFPSTYDIQYDSFVDPITPLTLTPSYMEAESGALSLWQLSRGQFTCHQMYKWPSYPSDSIYRAIHSTLAGDTLIVKDSLFGEWPDDPDTPGVVRYVAHWTQSDSVTVAERCTLGYVRSTGDTLLTTVTSRFTGLRRQLPAPEVNKTYFPALSYSSSRSSVTWWGRTMPESHGRQIDLWSTITGSVNGETLSGRAWGMLDTTGIASGYLYECFDSLDSSVPPPVLAWIEDGGPDIGSGSAMRTPRVKNLWSLSGGYYSISRTGVYPLNPADTFFSSASGNRLGTNLYHTIQATGTYSGPQDVVALRSERAFWYQLDSSTMREQGRGCAVRTGGDSVVTTFTSTFWNLQHGLNFDQVLSASFPESRSALGFLAATWSGMLDSASTAVAESMATRRPPSLELRVTPNPAIGSASISYILPAPGPCRLGLYDVSGKLIATLVSGLGRAGVARLKLQTSGLPKGIYVLRLESDGWTKATKLVAE
jgi:hypothetical protein